MSDRQFPAPFGGISHSWRMEAEEIEGAVAHLTAGCGLGHLHNFAVQVDGFRIYTTAMGIICLQQYFQVKVEAQS